MVKTVLEELAKTMDVPFHFIHSGFKQRDQSYGLLTGQVECYNVDVAERLFKLGDDSFSEDSFFFPFPALAVISNDGSEAYRVVVGTDSRFSSLSNSATRNEARKSLDFTKQLVQSYVGDLIRVSLNGSSPMIFHSAKNYVSQNTVVQLLRAVEKFEGYANHFTGVYQRDTHQHYLALAADLYTGNYAAIKEKASKPL